MNRHGRFRESDILRTVFEEVVCGCMTAGLVGGEGFAVDASLYTLLQILSVTLFEKMPIHQALAGDENRCNASQITNQLNLFDF